MASTQRLTSCPTCGKQWGVGYWTCSSCGAIRWRPIVGYGLFALVALVCLYFNVFQFGRDPRVNILYVGLAGLVLFVYWQVAMALRKRKATSGLTLESMPAIGAHLRMARERLGITIEEIASRTHISVGGLQALERGDAKALPGGMFSRAFVRAYAREVGFDVQQLLALPPLSVNDQPPHHQDGQQETLTHRAKGPGSPGQVFEGAGSSTLVVTDAVIHGRMEGPLVALVAPGVGSVQIVIVRESLVDTVMSRMPTSYSRQDPRIAIIVIQAYLRLVKGINDGPTTTRMAAELFERSFMLRKSPDLLT